VDFIGNHLPKHVGVNLEYINKIHWLLDAFCWSFTTISSLNLTVPHYWKFGRSNGVMSLLLSIARAVDCFQCFEVCMTVTHTSNAKCGNVIQANKRSATFANAFMVVLKTVSKLWGFSRDS
jgi:hypothetical protein